MKTFSLFSCWPSCSLSAFGLCSPRSGRLDIRLGERLGHRLGTAFLSRVFHQPWFFRASRCGGFGRAPWGPRPLQEALTQGVVLALLDAVMALSTLALMLAYAPTLTAVTVLALALYSGVLMALPPAPPPGGGHPLLTGVEMEARFLGTFAELGSGSGGAPAG